MRLCLRHVKTDCSVVVFQAGNAWETVGFDIKTLQYVRQVPSLLGAKPRTQRLEVRSFQLRRSVRAQRMIGYSCGVVMRPGLQVVLDAARDAAVVRGRDLMAGAPIDFVPCTKAEAHRAI